MKKDYVRIYGEEVERFRALNPKSRPDLQRHHVWPKSLGGENKVENYVYVTGKQHRYLHRILNLALLQSGNPGAVVTLDYSPMERPGDLDLSMFRNSRIIMEKRGGMVSMSLTKAAELCSMLCPARRPLDEIRWRVLIAAVFGNKYMGFRMSLKLHRRKDDAAIGRLKAAMGENSPVISA